MDFVSKASTVAFFAACAGIALLSIAPGDLIGSPAMGRVPLWSALDDGQKHAIGYAVAALLGTLAFGAKARLAGGLFAFGVVLEALQHAMGLGRAGEWSDVAANSIGIVAGLVIGALVLASLRRFAQLWG